MYVFALSGYKTYSKSNTNVSNLVLSTFFLLRVLYVSEKLTLALVGRAKWRGWRGLARLRHAVEVHLLHRRGLPLVGDAVPFPPDLLPNVPGF